MNITVIGRKCTPRDSFKERVDKKLSKVAIKSRDKIPYTTKNGVHDNRHETDPTWWTNGFFGALMWAMYLGTKNEEYKKTAEYISLYSAVIIFFIISFFTPSFSTV